MSIIGKVFCAEKDLLNTYETQSCEDLLDTNALKPQFLLRKRDVHVSSRQKHLLRFGKGVDDEGKQARSVKRSSAPADTLLCDGMSITS